MSAHIAEKRTNPVPKKHCLTIDDFHRMGEVGIFGEGDHVELIEGEIIDMAPIGSRHAECVTRLAQMLIRQGMATVRVQNPILLPYRSEPEPDIAAVLKRSYADAHPGPKDVLLLIEVADSSLAYDRDTKIPLYASFGIPEVWLVDLEAECIDVYVQPTVAGYQQILAYGKDKTLTPTKLSGVSIPISEIFKP
jgi:Uma2 family endonuclease